MVWTDWTLAELKAVLQNRKVDAVILSATGQIPEGVENYLQQHFYFIRLSHETPLPFVNRYLTPATLGRDRIAGVAGAHRLFPGHNCLVIDAGTCITYDLLTANGEYLGGNIAPGLEMRLKAMHSFTARLPLVERTDAAAFIGNTTETAMQSGAQWGALLEINGFIGEFERQFPNLRVILSGGDADYFKNYIITDPILEKNIVLIGLNQILNYNVLQIT